MSRPELQLPPDLFYDNNESRKYTSSSRIIRVQAEIANRCIELLSLPEGKSSYILDVGCGSGLSGQALEEAGHVWVGCDISPSMLEVAAEQADSDAMGDVMRHDMGLGLPFTQATFDGCISVSALQWLCYSDVNTQSGRRRLTRFFSSLYSCLKRGAKAALQFYPENPEQAVLIAQCANEVGFMGGVVIDFPNSSKAKKYYLCLGFDRGYAAPSGLNEQQAAEQSSSSGVRVERGKQQTGGKSMRGGSNKGKQRAQAAKDWVMSKKEKRRNANKETRRDSKYTARKRKDRF